METVDFLDGEAASLPKTRTGDFPAFLEQIFNAYQADLRRVGDDNIIDRVIKEKITKVARLSEAVKEIVGLAAAGDRGAAYDLLHATLIDLGGHLRCPMPPGDMSGLINPLYRFRPTEPEGFYEGRHLSHSLPSQPHRRRNALQHRRGAHALSWRLHACLLEGGDRRRHEASARNVCCPLHTRFKIAD